MIRSYDPSEFKRVVSQFPKEFKYDPETFDFEGWVGNKNNVLYLHDDSIGLCTCECLGIYTVHWFFKERGRKALDLAVDMLTDLFYNGAKIVRGITPIENKAARWAARQIGMKSHGILSYPEEDCELFIMTKEDLTHG